MFGHFNRLWIVGRRSERAYVRFYPNPGFMFPWFGGKRIRWAWHDRFRVTKAPTPGNPKGL